MSKFYFDWFMMCYNKEPATVTLQQLGVSLQRGMLTKSEYDKIMVVKHLPVVEGVPTGEDLQEPTEEDV